jgi:predicted nucleic acid-binding protein
VILIDTGPLVALCDQRDSRHRTALKHLETLARRRLAVCGPVLTEACFHLPHLAQRQRLSGLLDGLRIQWLPVEHEAGFTVEVFDWLFKYADHEPDWADACLAVLSGADGGLKVWTYDREFRDVWRRPDGSAIPMAVRP